MYTVIQFREAIENNSIVRIYEDSTEKGFLNLEDANQYAAYLNAKKAGISGWNTDIYEKVVYAQGELNIEDLKKQDALEKLTEEEKTLLGVQ